MNNHQTLTPAPREHDSAPPPLPHDPKHNATHIDLRTTWKHTAFPAPRNILQAPNATQRRTVLRRSPNSSRTGPSVREHHAKLPRIMASARPSSLTHPRPAQSQHNATQQTNTRHRPNQTHLCFHHACATTLSTILRRKADSASTHLQRPNYAYANSAPPPLPHDAKHNATHTDLRTTWQHTAFPAPRNILQAPNATQRRTVIRRSPNTSRTGPSVREHHAKLPRIMASARPSSLTSPRPAQSQHNATQQTNTRHRPNQTHLCFHHTCATTLSTILRRNADSASTHLQRLYAYANISVSSIHYAHGYTYSNNINYAPTII